MASHEKPTRPPLGRLILSVLAAAIGVQNKKNLEEDFSQSSPLPFIFAGLLFTAAFIGVLYLVAKLAIES